MENVKTQLDAIIEQATHKFGKVYGYTTKENGTRILAIERKEPALPHLPFMTINASIYGMTNQGEYAADFYWGHYDLGKNAALENIKILLE